MGILDAWAYGIPVITTPVGGITDVVKNDINGLIFQTYNLHELAACIEKLIKSNDYRNKIVQEADKLVQNEFNIININKQLENIYSSL